MARIVDYRGRMKDWPGRRQTWTLLTPAEFERLKPTMQRAIDDVVADSDQNTSQRPADEPGT